MPSWAWVGLGLRVGRGLCSGARSVLHMVAKIFAFVTVKAQIAIACPRGTHNHTKVKENVMQLMLPMMHGRLLLPCMQ